MAWSVKCSHGSMRTRVKSLAWWYTFVIPEHGEQRQPDSHPKLPGEFQDNERLNIRNNRVGLELTQQLRTLEALPEDLSSAAQNLCWAAYNYL